MAYVRKVSASQINMHTGCNRLYYYKYILKLKEPSTVALICGSFFHSIHERFFELNPRDCNINFRNYTTEFYNYADKVFDEVLNEDRTSFGKPVPSYSKQLQTVCDDDFTYIKALTDVKKSVKNWMALYIMQFQAYAENAKGFAQAFYMSCPVRNEMEIKHPKFTGFIDSVIKKDSLTILRDLKTSKIFRSAHDDSYERQLNLYCYGYHYMTDEIADFGSLFYAKYGIEALYKFDKKNIIDDMEILIDSFYDLTESKSIDTYPCNYNYMFCTCKASKHPEGFKDGAFRCYYDKYCNQEIDGYDIVYD